ncbi:ABC-three component system middle component 7 [Paenibacillus sp. FSL R7-0337]|uniref:ABC-three component system middle component 7 n=1 Tax=Paenibacillus sp. FSL R7-0337 TaxID=1926588 RepID=UPI00096F3523|nr:ABC-three component system middle component 7 [Paenibacillus sp. FSL R7-0337]OMF88739.1 hypothetical protein BK147_26395 [Paenibacillus sp. FSL R7-0337]
MIIPNKIIRFDQSIIGKMLFVMDKLDSEIINIQELYAETSEHFEEITEFIYSLDVLYVLDVIDYDLEKGLLVYAKGD